MSTATIASKGQITIPKDVRDRLDLKTGDKLNFQVENDGTARLHPLCLRPADVFGMLKSKIGASATLKQIDMGLAKAFRKGKL